MKTHIGEIEKPKRSGNETNIELLNDTERSLGPDSFCRSLVSDVPQHLKQIGEPKSELRDLGSDTTANCFVCDPDWCPDYKRRICSGKRLT